MGILLGDAPPVASGLLEIGPSVHRSEERPLEWAQGLLEQAEFGAVAQPEEQAVMLNPFSGVNR